MIKNKKYFVDSVEPINLYVTCIKYDENSNAIWAERYRDSKSAGGNVYKPSSAVVEMYADIDIFETLKEGENLNSDSWAVIKVPLSEDDIKNGYGTINFMELFYEYIYNNGDGKYLIQIYFMNDNEEKICSLPSEILEIEIILPTPSPTPTITPTPLP